MTTNNLSIVLCPFCSDSFARDTYEEANRLYARHLTRGHTEGLMAGSREG